MDFFCSNCGNQLREGARFCNKCGKPVNTEPDNAFQNQQIQNYNQFQNGMNQIANPPYPIQYNQPNYGYNYPQNFNQQPNNNYQTTIKENLTYGIAVKNLFSCSFSGRCSRWEWWFTFLSFSLPIGVILNLVILAIIGRINNDYRTISGIVGLIFLIPYIALNARRLHDLNMSGWAQLILLIPSVLSYFVPQPPSYSYSYNYHYNPFDSPIFIAYLISCVIIIPFIIYFTFFSGTPGSNKYGPPSKY